MTRGPVSHTEILPWWKNHLGDHITLEWFLHCVQNEPTAYEINQLHLLLSIQAHMLPIWYLINNDSYSFIGPLTYLFAKHDLEC